MSANLRLPEIAEEVGSDWPLLAQELNVPNKDIDRLQEELSDPDKRSLEMLQLWVKQAGIMATGRRKRTNRQNLHHLINLKPLA